MKRRSFLQAIIGLGVATSAGFVSLCTKCTKCKPIDEVSKPELYCEEGLGFTVIDNVDIIKGPFDQPSQQTTLEHRKNLEENSKYKAKWNVNGSWSKVENRSALISHLSGSNHGYQRSYLNTLSTDELQMLHDKDHESRKPTTRRWLFRR
jgi:hypothetical protein